MLWTHNRDRQYLSKYAPNMWHWHKANCTIKGKFAKFNFNRHSLTNIPGKNKCLLFLRGLLDYQTSNKEDTEIKTYNTHLFSLY